MIDRAMQQADMNRVSQLVSDFKPVLPSDDLERLRTDIVLAGLV